MFSKSKFCPEIEVKFPVPKAHGGGTIVLALSLATNNEFNRVRSAFLALPESERTGETVLEVIRSFVCSLLLRSPEGIEDFPIQTRRPEVSNKTDLYFRALDYFTGNEPELQDFFDDLLMTAWKMYKEFSEPETFPGTVSDSSQGESGSSTITAETSSDLR